MKFIRLLFCLYILTLSGIEVYSQNARKYYKTGNDFLKEDQAERAITYYNRAIRIEPDYDDAYLARAQAYEKIEKPNEAARDYMKAAHLFEKETDVYYHAGRLLYQVGEYGQALDYLNRAIDLKNKNLDALHLKVLVLVELKDYYKALRAAKESLDVKTTAFGYYYHGLASGQINNYKGAMEDYQQAINEDETYIPPYLALAQLQLTQTGPDAALKTINDAIKLNPKLRQSYIIRSKAQKAKLNYPQAINDISKAILLDESNAEELYVIRGKYYIEFMQYQNAIVDFNKVLENNPNHVEATYLRASCYEEISDEDAAIDDYKKLQNILKNKENASEIITKINQRLFVLNKEEVKPVLSIIEPKPINELIIEAPKNQVTIALKGSITDKNPISYLKINNEEVAISEGEDNTYHFSTNVEINDNELITITTADVYNNILQATYTVKRTEIEPPDVEVMAPYANENGEIFLSEEGPYLYIEGKIKDESLIDLIMIDDVMASYRPEDINPTFSATLDVSEKDKFAIKVIDRYGNATTEEFALNREHIAEMKSNPMGKTWVVFIENSDYSFYSSLDGPETDVTLIKSALANYQINNLIHKEDMTKHEMERFFSIELRDLIRSNRVNSILIWYAGHGKVINETGYWLPVDAKRDDEFSYFNINALKASMQSYSRYVTHTLVITDACESGPTFFQAMRSAPVPPECGDWKSTKFKSSQVFTSAGEETASDDSQFTRTFATALASNPEACISIEEIVEKVTAAVTHSSNQEPRFGKISGLEDEDGTFFFIAKQ